MQAGPELAIYLFACVLPIHICIYVGGLPWASHMLCWLAETKQDCGPRTLQDALCVL